LSTCPLGKCAIPLKWVFRVKRDATGNFEKYKARIVVKGYSQLAGLDFNDTFAPVVRVDSIRVIFAIAAANDLFILHVDCKNAFLHGKSDVDIYVSTWMIRWYVIPSKGPSSPQVSLWAQESTMHLVPLSLWPHHRPWVCRPRVGYLHLHLRTTPRCSLCRWHWSRRQPEELWNLLPRVGKSHQSQEQSPIKRFLDINVIWDSDKHLIAINQNAKSAGSPLDPSLPRLKAKLCDKIANEMYYQHVTGSLNHLAIYTRPDIAFAICKLAQSIRPLRPCISKPQCTYFFISKALVICVSFRVCPYVVPPCM